MKFGWAHGLTVIPSHRGLWFCWLYLVSKYKKSVICTVVGAKCDAAVFMAQHPSSAMFLITVWGSVPWQKWSLQLSEAQSVSYQRKSQIAWSYASLLKAIKENVKDKCSRFVCTVFRSVPANQSTWNVKKRIQNPCVFLRKHLAKPSCNCHTLLPCLLFYQRGLLWHLCHSGLFLRLYQLAPFLDLFSDVFFSGNFLKFWCLE